MQREYNICHFFKHIYTLVFAFVLIFLLCFQPVEAASKTIVESRLAQVEKVYANGKQINDVVDVTYYNSASSTERIIHNEGCNALVAYTTLKIFHNAFTPYNTSSYRQIGMASTSNTTALYALMKKAKVGDVIAFTERKQSPDSDSHYAIFEKCDAKGIYLYEANFRVSNSDLSNKVYSNHRWAYNKIKSWSNSSYVRIYRSKNYDSVNRKTAAKNLKKGSYITIRKIKYKVISSNINNAKLQVVAASASGMIPKYVGLNYDDWDSSNNTLVYSKIPTDVNAHGNRVNLITDEQFYTVVK